MDSPFQPGDPVIWWKRIPGGEYVEPIAATVLAITEHRVKIRADDNGRQVTRYVQATSLQPRAQPPAPDSRKRGG
jgi:hypothetical protein